MKNLPKHISLYITHNDHKSLYVQVEEYLKTRGITDSDFVNSESREKAIMTNELWCIQWYPRTPVVVCSIYGHDLEEMLFYLNNNEEVFKGMFSSNKKRVVIL